MADKSDEKTGIWQPFTDIVGAAKDEGYVNLANDITKKITIPSGLFDKASLVYTASTGRFEAASPTSPTQVATASGALVLTNANQDVAGTTLTLAAGTYKVDISMELTVSVLAAGFFVVMQSVLSVGTLSAPNIIVADMRTIYNNTFTTHAIASVPSAGTIKLQARFTGGAGTATVQNGNSATTLTVMKIG